MATESFNSNEVRQITEIKRGELENWISEGYVVASYLEDAACGKRCMWSRDDIYKVAVFKKLINLGLRPQVAHEVFEIKSDIDNKIETLFGNK